MKWVRDKTGRFAQRLTTCRKKSTTSASAKSAHSWPRNTGKWSFPSRRTIWPSSSKEKADLDSYADLSGEPGEVEGVTEFVPHRRPVVRISGALSAPNMENRLRTTLTHEYGHVHFHQFIMCWTRLAPQV